MDSKLKIAVLPLNIAWCDCEENLLAVADKLPKLHPDTDLLVLPELFSTGFVQDPNLLRQIGRSAGEMTLAAVKLWSRHFNMAVAGSYLAMSGNSFVNRGFIVEPSGEETFYDKRHLFCLSAESEIFRHGESVPDVVRFRGWNIMPAICYDLRFPVWCRNQNERYDLLVIPANWPAARAYAWKHLLIARAIENQAVVVGANRSGRDDYGDYSNLSFVFDPFGKLLAPTVDKSSSDTMSSAAPDAIFYAEYSMSQLKKARTVLPVGRDADKFQII